MQVFDRAVTDRIAERFYIYFHPASLSLREARDLIEREIGPTNPPSKDTTVDYAKPRVQSSGRGRPSENEIEAIYRRNEENDLGEWRAVFDELMRRLEREPEAERFVKLVYQKRYETRAVCKRMNIEEVTYWRYRKIILEKAGVIAVSKGLLCY